MRPIPPRLRTYAVPYDWAERHQIRRWGFHGASHRYIATRMAELTGRSELRIISCHLGGSSSLCAIRGGKSVATSMGMSPQSGLPQNNRVGDFDPFAIPARDAGDRQIARRGVGRPGGALRFAGPERHKRRHPRFGTSGCRRKRTREIGARRVHQRGAALLGRVLG